MTSIRVRPARPEDHEAMLAITQPVWNGRDYVPFIWDEWLGRPVDSLLVATASGRAVGLQHVERQPDGSAWLEGIRVAEEARGEGVGEALLDAGLRWARHMDCSTARLSIAANNPASLRLSEKAGFRTVGTFRNLSAGPDNCEPAKPVRVAQAEDEAEVRAALARAGLEVPNVTYTEGWTAYALTEVRLRLLLATNAVALAGTDRIEALAIATSPTERPSIRLGLIVGASAGVEALGCFLRRRAAAALVPRVRGTVEANDAKVQALVQAGFERGDVDMLLRERRLSA